MHNAEGEIIYTFQDKWHVSGIMIAGFIFIGLVLLLGGKKGVQALVSLGLSILFVFYIFIPLLGQGVNVMLLTFFVSILITVLTILIILGFKKKSLTAILGTLSGIAAALFLGYVFKWLVDINGMGSEDSRILAVQFPNFDFEGLFLAGVVLGALGAVMDVAVSIASGLEEVSTHAHERLARGAILRSGLTIGRDILGSMINTLIFAYVGASLTLIILFVQTNTSLVDILNLNYIAEEIVRSLVGSIGLIATIPFTALLASHFYRSR
jgi:uncharacterized membrane protein